MAQSLTHSVNSASENVTNWAVIDSQKGVEVVGLLGPKWETNLRDPNIFSSHEDRILSQIDEFVYFKEFHEWQPIFLGVACFA